MSRLLGLLFFYYSTTHISNIEIYFLPKTKVIDLFSDVGLQLF